MATLTLVYEDEQEIELRLSGVSFRLYYELATSWDALSRPEATAEDIRAYYVHFGDALLLRWTYPEDPTGENFLDRDIGYVKAVIRDWFTAMTEVAPPLPLRSSASGLPLARRTEQPDSRSGRRSSSGSRSSRTKS